MSRSSAKFVVAMCILASLAVSAYGYSASGYSSNKFWSGDIQENVAAWRDGTYCPVREFNRFVNSVFLPDSVGEYLEEKMGENAGYYMTTYIRDVMTGTMVYWIFAGMWHFFIYIVWVKDFFLAEKRPQPTDATIIDQMLLAQSSVFLYAALPVFSGFLIENKLTMTYYYVDEVGGWGMYFALLVAYMTFVEIGIYWMHRILHTNKFLYKYIHSLHHKYNSAVTMTPWCSIAFHPVDGVLQASPYVAGIFLVPCHYYTHVFLVFFSAVWATNIHDSLWGDTEPLMGSKYHLLHHTHYHYNYGQYFIFCDYFWGTYRVPERTLLNPKRASSKLDKVLETMSNDTDNMVDTKLKLDETTPVKDAKDFDAPSTTKKRSAAKKAK
jgi:Delta7-sterol 5-desaturase